MRAVLCSLLPEKVADDFIAHRKAKRAKMTVRAAELIVGSLMGHHDPSAVINESIAKGWTGVFPDKVLGGKGTTPPRAPVIGTRRTDTRGRLWEYGGAVDGWGEVRE